MRSSRSRAYAGPLLLAGLLGVVLGGLTVLAGPATAARTVVISITAGGPVPKSANAAVGDTIAFRNDDPTFIHQIRSDSANWTFNTGPLAPGQQVPAGTVTKPGTYAYAGANLDSFSGQVVVPGSGPAPRSPSSPSAGAAGGAPGSSTSPSPSPSSTGGAGSAGAPFLGGFGSLPAGSPSPGASELAPAVAPVLPPEQTGAAPSGRPGVLAEPGTLPESVAARRLGLPAALATVAALGVLSLIVRVLLAQPTDRPGRGSRRTA